MKNGIDACARRLLFCRSLSVGVENKEWTTLESITAQVSYITGHLDEAG
jgi:hypothetical protein